MHGSAHDIVRTSDAPPPPAPAGVLPESLPADPPPSNPPDVAPPMPPTSTYSVLPGGAATVPDTVAPNPPSVPPPAAPVADTLTLETSLGTANVCSDPVYWYVHVTTRPVCVQLVASPRADPVSATAQSIGSVTVVNPQRIQRNHLGTSGSDALTPGLGAQRFSAVLAPGSPTPFGSDADNLDVLEGTEVCVLGHDGGGVAQRCRRDPRVMSAQFAAGAQL